MKSAEQLYLVCELQKSRGEKIQIISITPKNMKSKAYKTSFS